MTTRSRDPNVWVKLTVPIAILMAIAAASGVFASGVYHDAPRLVSQAIAQDAITLVAVLPTLVIGALLIYAGSLRARLVWLGGLVYTVYTYVGYAFSVHFNSLFLVYVALLGCSTYALIGGLVTMNWTGIRAGFGERTPVKAVSIYLAVIAILFYSLWLSEALPASMTGKPAPSLVDAGTPTNFVQVLDMAWLLPAMAITAVKLWRKQAIGYALAGAFLTFFVLLTSAILSMVAFMVRAGEPVAIPQVVIFGALFAASLGMVFQYLKNLRPSHVRT